MWIKTKIQCLLISDFSSHFFKYFILSACLLKHLVEPGNVHTQNQSLNILAFDDYSGLSLIRSPLGPCSSAAVAKWPWLIHGRASIPMATLAHD